MSGQAVGTGSGTSGQTLLLVRWILIIATAYLILYRNPVRIISPMVGLFLAGYLGSNLIVAGLLRHVRSQTLNTAIAVFDAILVSAALVLTQTNPADLLVLYFVVILIATLPESLALITAAAGLIAVGQLFEHVKIMPERFSICLYQRPGVAQQIEPIGFGKRRKFLLN